MESEERQAAATRDINVCATCTHFDSEAETPYCHKFKQWPESVVQDCGGPY